VDRFSTADADSLANRLPLGRSQRAGGEAGFKIGCGDAGFQRKRATFVRRAHGHVDVLKNHLWGNPPTAVGGLDQVVAGLAAMFPSEGVDECERLGELLSFDQEASAVDFPCGRRFSHVPFTLRGRENEKAFSICDCRFSISALSKSDAWLEARLRLVKNFVKDESTRASGCGQSPRLVQSRKIQT